MITFRRLASTPREKIFISGGGSPRRCLDETLPDPLAIFKAPSAKGMERKGKVSPTKHCKIQKKTNLAAPWDVKKTKAFRRQGGFISLIPHQGLCPLDPAGGFAPQTPSYRLALPRSPCAVQKMSLEYALPRSHVGLVLEPSNGLESDSSFYFS